MKKKFDPFKNLVLDEYEQEIEDNLPDILDMTPLPKKELNRLSRMAKDTLLDLKKDKNMNIRVSKVTIDKLKKKAAKLGLGYQTMVGSILHQFANS